MNASFFHGGSFNQKKISEHFQVHAFLRDIPGAENALGTVAERSDKYFAVQKK